MNLENNNWVVKVGKLYIKRIESPDEGDPEIIVTLTRDIEQAGTSNKKWAETIKKTFDGRVVNKGG